MIEFVVLRHGQSTGDLEARHKGRYDTPLTERGREQAQRAAMWIAEHLPPSAVYASPLRRAAETAEILAQQAGVAVHYDADLMEFNNGALAGLLFTEAAERYPEPVGGYKAHEPVPGGESDITFRARAEIVWSRLLSETIDGQRIAIVAHGGIISRLFQCFLNLPMQADLRLVTSDTGIHLWRIEGANRYVVFTNRSDHLRQEWRG